MPSSYQLKEERIQCALKAWPDSNYASLTALARAFRVNIRKFRRSIGNFWSGPKKAVWPKSAQVAQIDPDNPSWPKSAQVAQVDPDNSSWPKTQLFTTVEAVYNGGGKSVNLIR